LISFGQTWPTQPCSGPTNSLLLNPDFFFWRRRASAKGRVRNGRFASETAERRFQKRNAHLDPEAVKEPVGVGASAVESSIHNSFSSRKAGEMSAVIVMVIVIKRHAA
jgi:hypothetical protein